MQEDGSSSATRLDCRRYLRSREECVSEPLPPISDAQFQTDADAQTRFVQANLRRIFLLIYRIVGNVDDAQDLTQETFIKALQRASQLKDLDKAAHWLARIASNTAIDHLRRARKVNFSAIGDVPEPWMIANADSPEQLVLREERKLQLDDGLALLTERERMALLLRDVEDMPADEVA